MQINPLVGAMLFPVVIILTVLLSLDLLTNSLGLVPWIETTQASSWDLRTAVDNLIGGFVFTGLALRCPQIPRDRASGYADEGAGRGSMTVAMNLRATTDGEIDPAEFVA